MMRLVDKFYARPRTVVLALVVMALLSPARAWGEVMDTTASLRAGQLSLGSEFQVGLREGVPLLVNFHEAVGLARGVDLQARQAIGLSDQPLYLGGGIKWTVLSGSSRRNRPGVALWLGGHARLRHGGSGPDATVAIDYPFGRVRPYLGLDANLEFYGDDIDFLLGLVGGLRISLVRNVAWFVEGGLGILGDVKPHFVSTGLRVYI